MGYPASKLLSLVLAGGVALPAWAAPPRSGEDPNRLVKLYCCEVDGQKTCGDTLPPQCQKRAYKELNSLGVAREVGPPLTPEQQAQKVRDEQRRKEEEAVQKEQARKDTALLNTYSSEKDIDLIRSRNEQEMQGQIKQSENKVADAQKHLKRLQDEMEFYKHRPAPSELGKNIRDAEYDLRLQKELLERKNQELQQIRSKYDQDKRRYIELTRARAANPAGLHPALVHPAPPPAVERPR
ncbi:MAG: hypothetical protein AB7E15_04340 [Azospira sp.]|jgi:hypothetical protein